MCATQQSCSRWFFEIKFNLIHLRCIHILLLYLCLHPRCFFSHSSIYFLFLFEFFFLSFSFTRFFFHSVFFFVFCFFILLFLSSIFFGWLAGVSGLETFFSRRLFNDFALLFRSTAKKSQQHCHYQPEANSTETIYLSCLCSDHKWYSGVCVFFFVCLLPAGDIWGYCFL